MTKPQTFDGHGWLVDDTTLFAMAGCITLVAGVIPAEAARRIGADPSSVVAFDQIDRGEWLSWISIASVHEGALDAGVVLIEDNGWEGARPEVLAALSKGGSAASVFWNVEDVVRFGCARRGKPIASVELPDPEDVDDLPSMLRRLVQRAPDDANPVALGALLAERFTGVPLSQVPAVARPATAFPITSPVLDLPATAQELVGLQYPSAGVVRAVEAATPIQRRALAEWATRQAVILSGLGNDPHVALVLTQFGRGAPTRLSAEVSALRRVTAARGSGDRPAREFWALNAVAYTGVADSKTAALGATYCAGIINGLGSETYYRFLEDAVRILAD